MLKCRDVAHQTSDYIDNTMSGWPRLRFRFHLLICFYCRRFVNHVRVTRDFVRKKPMRETDSAEVARVMKAIENADKE